MYFTAGYGHRDRIVEALDYIKHRHSANDKISLLGMYKMPEETKFYIQYTAMLMELPLSDDQIIVDSNPEKLELNNSI